MQKIIEPLAGSWKYSPHEIDKLSSGAVQLIRDSFKGIEGPVSDHHCHLLVTEKSGGYVHPHMHHHLVHPFRAIRYDALKSATGVDSDETFDQDYLDRLIDLVSSAQKQFGWGKQSLLALDKKYNSSGLEVLDGTAFYTPNDYLLNIVDKHHDLFFGVGSVHPYRKDALFELERLAGKGIKTIKWLPNAMGIDPSHKLCDDFYSKMKELDMTLLVHTGKENSMDVPGIDHSLGNPLLLRKPLEKGVKVIAAHMATMGQSEDLDDPKGTKVNNWDLCFRMFDQAKYRDLLYGDVSALAEVNRIGSPVAMLLDRTDIHSRLVYGTDYPLPSMSVSNITSALQLKGFITSEEREYLSEIWNINPILYDFVAKRCMKSPNTGSKFSPVVFSPKLELFGHSDAHSSF
jgi:predicted TIM-barrel fold metal-dependent hydrolase